MNFSHKITSSKNPELHFFIRPLTKDNLEESARFISKVYAKSLPTVLFFNVKEEEVFNYVHTHGQIGLEKGLSIVVYDESDNIVGALFNDDLYEHSTLRAFNPKIIGSVALYNSKKVIFYSTSKDCPDLYHASQPGESVLLDLAAIAPQYAGHGILKNMTRFLINDHEQGKLAKKFVIDSCVAAANHANSSIGFSKVGEIHVERFQDHQGNRPFNGISQFMGKIGSPFNGTYYMLRFVRGINKLL